MDSEGKSSMIFPYHEFLYIGYDPRSFLPLEVLDRDIKGLSRLPCLILVGFSGFPLRFLGEQDGFL